MATFRHLGLATVLCAIGAFAQGCVDNEVSLFIVQSQVPQLGGTTGCTVTPDPAALRRNNGTLDLSIRTNYTIFPLYRSELLSSAHRATSRPEYRGMFVDGADIVIQDTDPNSANPTIASFRVPTTAFVPAASSDAPGYAVADLEILPSSIGQLLALQYCQADTSDTTPECPVPVYASNGAQYIITVRPFGHTMGGVYISGSHYNFTLNVCCHCLVQFQAAADDPAYAGPDCSNSTSTPTSVCNVGQDDEVDCRLCSVGNTAACQPRGYQSVGPMSMVTCPR